MILNVFDLYADSTPQIHLQVRALPRGRVETLAAGQWYDEPPGAPRERRQRHCEI